MSTDFLTNMCTAGIFEFSNLISSQKAKFTEHPAWWPRDMSSRGGGGGEGAESGRDKTAHYCSLNEKKHKMSFPNIVRFTNFLSFLFHLI